MLLRQALIAEFIGTFFLVLAGTGAIIVDHLTHAVTHVGVSLVFGLVVAALVYALAHISGAHFNPAVTIGFFAAGEFSGKRAGPYIIAQVLGSIAASSVLWKMFGNVASVGVTMPSGPVSTSFWLELFMTFLLVFVILGSAVHGRATKSFAGIAIGSTIALDALFGGPISGASMNPARSIGPAFVAGLWQSQWLYLIAPVAGAMLAVIGYKLVSDRRRMLAPDGTGFDPSPK